MGVCNWCNRESGTLIEGLCPTCYDNKYGKPNNNCGECGIWLAFDEPEGLTAEEAFEKYCSKCEVWREDNE